MARPLVIFGNAEIASLAKFYFTHDSDYEVVAFAVDDDYVEESSFEGLPVVPFSELTAKYSLDTHDLHVALSYQRLNKLREEKYIQVKALGYKLASYVCSKSVFWSDLQIGDNCFILENQTIQPTVIIGNNVMMWSGNHIGHGTTIGDHTYLASHVVLSGNCNIGQRCFFGVNATVKDFTAVGDDVFIAMDASVVKDVQSGSVIMGAKGEVLTLDDRRARIIKRKYFGE
ncbi:acetyltransferase [Kiloniella majae]|uniref:acetyltransferase n=1 Tax=Kiloniella majae TaxID=1938558 RepID=UPI000A2770C4|nr:acetyltransferase [Kiloniella majae]